MNAIAGTSNTSPVSELGSKPKTGSHAKDKPSEAGFSKQLEAAEQRQKARADSARADTRAEARSGAGEKTEAEAEVDDSQAEGAEPEADLATEAGMTSVGAGLEADETSEADGDEPIDFDAALEVAEADAAPERRAAVVAPAKQPTLAELEAENTTRENKVRVEPTRVQRNTSDAAATLPATEGGSAESAAPRTAERATGAAAAARMPFVPDEIADEWAARASQNRARVVVGSGDDRVAVMVALEKEGVRIVAEAAAAETAEFMMKNSRELERALGRHGKGLIELTTNAPTDDNAATPEGAPATNRRQIIA